MEMKEMIRLGILVFAVFVVFVTGTGVVGAHINITDIGIKDDIPRVGFLEYQNTGLENQNGVLLITVDGVDVWEGEVRTYTYHVGDEIFSPVRYKYFSLMETNGTHQIEAVLKTDERSTNGIYYYIGLGVEESIEDTEEEPVEEEEICEDWLECP